ncbi:TetR family transcriptional regulator [Stackebrandtia albiflava]|uniref:TetR family transcriptional regulator n=1 Tax=Stackebrandtia albiflava TaxID=406432 RepID=A0A562V9M8_9ACTN|nr:TetR/AcrR family transcriptional regulator [Stackebrandtia albiflava]TWJ14580.1 TetR family transcriptional regulator [Stackebrandtia albiflava]
MPVRTKAEQRAATVRALLAHATELFGRHGYAAVGLADIAAAAGVTKGAVYHHFGSKTGLFTAVVESVQQQVGDRVAAAADAEPDPWRRLLTGCREFLAAGDDPRVRRIMLVDGPSVLGWREWRRLDEAASARHLAEALEELMAAGVVTRRPVEPLTRLLSGAMNEAALWLAEPEGSGDPDEVVAALETLLGSLRR